MQYTGLNELREKFLSFFESKGHLRLPSFPLLPQGDNSLLLINSGMAPMKPYFAGELTPPRVRVTTCQKCIRTPDIENVGHTSRHGTFFEMLGNFSFGDYFKREAMTWAWEFITQVLEIPVDKLFVSVYQDDDEAWELWTREIGVPEDRMIRLGKEDNFWEIGAGPCGPCSEIYFDRGEEHGCGSPNCAPGCDCDRYVEFWNLVFTQFYNDGEGNYSPLKQKNIDTGMGLERLACIMQGVNSLFEVDTVKNIMAHISRIAGVTYGADAQTDISLRIITDHIRSTTMMVCDGVMPSNEGRGYVLRRLLRRAARHGRLLGIQGAFLCDVCDTVIAESGDAYPELRTKSDYIKKVVRMEEDSFERTIDSGLTILNDMIAKLRAAGERTLSGADAFKLYDTYGFPIDLTLEILEEAQMSVDRATFDRLMNEQRERARAARAAMGDFAWESMELGLAKDVKTEFLGYTQFACDAKILAIVADGATREMIGADTEATLVLDRTVFYAESGGQCADTGRIAADGAVFEVRDVQKTKDGKFLHTGVVRQGSFSVSDAVTAEIDGERRRATMRAHSATHLLQKALRKHLGDHVEQAGSFVTPDVLRFDFTHFSALTPEELRAVEDEVNDVILAGLPITMREMPIDEAKKLGAMALFGEKYGNIVRVVTMGDYSIEFCGGTHLDNTAKAGLVRITAETSIAAGVRRIEAVCGKALVARLQSAEDVIRDTAAALKTAPAELCAKAGQTAAELKALRHEAEDLRGKLAAGDAQAMVRGAKDVRGLKLVCIKKSGMAGDALRKIGDQLRGRDENLAAVLASECDGKLVFVASCGKGAVARGVKAGDLVRAVAAVAGGKGGGKPDCAMAGGSDVTKVDAALAEAERFVSAAIKD